MVPINNPITCDWWSEICDWAYSWSNIQEKLIPHHIIPPNKSVVHVSLDEIKEFFNLIKNTKNKYVVVSSKSDYGLHYQTQYPVFADLPKWISMQLTPSHGYNGINLPPRCDLKKCRITDKYSLRMYSWTGSTFNEIPNIVKWFVVNNNIREDIVESIPFGIESKTAHLFANLTQEQLNQPRKLLYINLTANTLERFHVKQFYIKNHINGVTVITEPNRTKEQYIQDLLTHDFVLSMPGNGLSTYRDMESILCGCIPIVEDNILHRDMSELPIIRTTDFFNIVPFLRTLNRQDLIKQSSYEKATISYWKNKIEEARNLL